MAISLISKSGPFAMDLVKCNWVLCTPALKELLWVVYPVSAGGILGVNIQGQARTSPPCA